MMSNQEIALSLKQMLEFQNFSFLDAFGLAPKEMQVIQELLPLAVSQDSFPEFSGANKLVVQKNYNSAYLGLLRNKGIMVTGGKKGIWVLTDKLLKSIQKLAGETQKPTGSANPGPPPPPVEFPEDLNGRFKVLWDFLNQERKGAEDLALTQEHIARASALLECESQFIWDTLRKFESRGLLKRARRDGNAIVVQFGKTVKQPTKAASPVSAPTKAVRSKVRFKENTTVAELINVLSVEVASLDQEVAGLQQRLEEKRKQQTEKAAFLEYLKQSL